MLDQGSTEPDIARWLRRMTKKAACIQGPAVADQVLAHSFLDLLVVRSVTNSLLPKGRNKAGPPPSNERPLVHVAFPIAIPPSFWGIYERSEDFSY